MQRREHSPEAIAADLHERFWKRLVMFASRRLRDPGSAEDVAQETIRRVLDAISNDRIDNMDALPGFVFQTARNICMHHGRSARREQAALLRFSAGQRQDTGEDPVHELVSRERVEALNRAIGEIAPEEQDLLRMLFIEALDTRTVADRLGIDPGALRVRKHRLLKRLADRVERDSGNEISLPGTQESSGE